MFIKELTPRQLRRFIQREHEKTYALVDVRQPVEYEQGHIPGARLLPLPKLVQGMESLPADKRLVFYCHSGSRSLAAATMVADEGIGSGALMNLSGGMLAWDGGVTADYPNVQLFNRQAEPLEMLMTAMNLEKGAFNFYTLVSNKYRDKSWADIFAKLAKAEIGHARSVYRFHRQIQSGGDDFEAIFQGLDGEVLEGGIKLSQAVDHLSTITSRVCLGLIETALKIEYTAFDLYRTMADRVTVPDAGEAFITIAQAEKAHMQALAGAIDVCDP
jgi:rhodanese-related sulfurtransferase/rubrerythrin